MAFLLYFYSFSPGNCKYQYDAYDICFSNARRQLLFFESDGWPAEAGLDWDRFVSADFPDFRIFGHSPVFAEGISKKFLADCIGSFCYMPVSGGSRLSIYVDPGQGSAVLVPVFDWCDSVFAVLVPSQFFLFQETTGDLWLADFTTVPKGVWSDSVSRSSCSFEKQSQHDVAGVSDACERRTSVSMPPFYRNGHLPALWRDDIGRQAVLRSLWKKDRVTRH